MMKSTTRQDSIRFWNESAETYSNRQQGGMPDLIVRDLADSGVLGKDMNVCELGPGPGTYTRRLAPCSGHLTCVEAAENMIARLERNISDLDNVTPVLSDFAEYSPGKVFDTTVAALCPGTHTKEAIAHMSSMTAGTCVHIMWSEMCWDRIYEDAWQRFAGTKYPNSGNVTVMQNLKEMGLPYEERSYSQFLTVEFPFQVAVDKLIRSFSRFTDVPLTVEDATEYLSDYRDGDRFVCARTNRMRVVTWSVPESDVVHDA